MIAFLQATIGLLTAAFLYLYPFWILLLRHRLSLKRKTAWIAERRFDWLWLLILISGGLAIWLLWRFVLPDWWIAATPLWTGEED